MQLFCFESDTGEREHLTFAAQLEIGFLRPEAGGTRKEEQGRSQKKCFYKDEMLSCDRPIFRLIKFTIHSN